MKKILTVSLFAMMAVSAANADIASTDYVGNQITATAGTLTSLTTTEKGNLVGAINEVRGQLTSISEEQGGNLSAVEQSVSDLTDVVNAMDDAYKAADTALDGRLTTAEGKITIIEESDAMTSGITSDKVTKYDAYDARITTAKSTADGAVTVNTQQGTAISANTAAITKLNGDKNTTGSVLKSIEDNAVNTVTSGSANGTIAVDGQDVAVKGLGTAAYTPKTDYATSTQGTKADNAVARTQIGAAANFAITDECKAQGAVCSLVVRAGVAGWEKVSY